LLVANNYYFYYFANAAEEAGALAVRSANAAKETTDNSLKLLLIK